MIRLLLSTLAAFTAATAAADDKTPAFTAQTGREYITAVGWSSDGKLVAALPDDNVLRVFAADTGKEVRKIDQSKGSSAGVFAFSPDGKRIALSGGKKDITVWDVATGKLLATIDAKQHHMPMAFSPDGKTLAAAGAEGNVKGMVKFWDTTSYEERPPILDKDSNFASSVRWSPDGKLVVAAVGDHFTAYDVAAGKKLYAVKESSSMIEVRFGPSGKELVGVCDEELIRHYDPATGKKTGESKHGMDSVKALSPDEKTAVRLTAIQGFRIWDVAAPKELYIVQHDDYVTAAAFSPDGKRVALGSKDGSVRVYTVTGAK